MSTPQPPNDVTQPWWKRLWGILYLVLLGLVMAWVAAALSIRPDTLETQHVRNLSLQVSGLWLGLLLVIGVALGVFRRSFWRFPRSAFLDGIIGVTLFTVSTIAVVSFLGFACQVVTNR
jgi:hypothetical protein